MDVTTAIDTRISVRAFKDTPLPREEVEDWLTTGQRSPSGGNVQPWRTLVLTGDAKAAVSNLAGEILMTNPKGEATDRPVYPPNLWEPYNGRRRRVGEMMYETLGIPREDRPARLAWFANNFNFFGAPLALFFVIDERMGHGQWAHMGMYMQTLALLAVERGWGTCMQECWGVVRPSLKTHFGLSQEEMVYCGMSVGIPDPDHPVNTLRAERADLKDVAEFYGF
ncbi:MAG: nitroreductase [Pseudomonadota bacterium]